MSKNALIVRVNLFVSNKKIKLIFSDAAASNSIAANTSLNNICNVYIPSELCEIRGLAFIHSHFTEVEFHSNTYLKNLVIFGLLPAKLQKSYVSINMTIPLTEFA